MQQPSSGPQMPQDPQSVPVQVPKNESTSVQPEPPADPQVLPELKPEPAQVPKTESSGVCPEVSASSHREVNDIQTTEDTVRSEETLDQPDSVAASPECDSDASVDTVRRSDRVRRRPNWMSDYHVESRHARVVSRVRATVSFLKTFLQDE
ncbi:hypothetical protein BaRGS_00037785 [Batillaria attramentaria]|uniref:Uncharacterized protein n=1 Tax=Batillaria attramentaria TaxID=370345 RepID=A0ABD0J7Y3_9CAEN